MTTALNPPFELPRRWRLICLVAATLVYVGLVPFSAVGAIFGWLVFDNRGNLINPLAWIAFLQIIAFWVVCIVAPFLAWVFWTRGQEKRAWAAVAVPLAWVVVAFALLQIIPT